MDLRRIGINVAPLLSLVLIGSLVLMVGPALATAHSTKARRVRPQNDRARVVAAIRDVKVALAEVTEAERGGASAPDPFRRAAQRAINALVGSHDSSFDPTVGTPGDVTGAIPDLNKILDRRGTFPWTAPLDGAVANLSVAVITFQTARHVGSLTKYEFAVSDAVEDLEMALGRPSESGPLGGLEGVLSSTTLGVPSGGREVSACILPTRGPVYGVYKGYLAYVALPLHRGELRLPQAMGEREVSVTPKLLVLHTPVAALVAKLCHRHGMEKSGALARPERYGAGSEKEVASIRVALPAADSAAATSRPRAIR